MKEIRYYFCILIDHPAQPGKRISPIAAQFTLDARQKEGEDIKDWIGVPEGVRRSLIKLDADNCIMSITAEATELDKLEASSIVKRIELSKTVAEQTKSTVDLVKYGALSTDTAEDAIKKVCKGIDANLETFFDRQKDQTVDSKLPQKKVTIK